MTDKVFTKQYACAQARSEAVENYAWLAGAASTLTLPAIQSNDAHWIEFEHVDGHHLGPTDLPAYAGHLGAAHAEAWAAELRHARLDEAYEPPGRAPVRDFITPRNHLVDTPELQALAHGPVAFYKDANLRNTLVTDTGTLVTVDFDSLTLAPFGYDLAKCVVSLAMTYGQLPDMHLRLAWARYNTAAAARERCLTTAWPTFLAMADLNARLTAPYLGRHGYTHPWRRPAEHPEDTR
jgi:hypothetical protein